MHRRLLVGSVTFFSTSFRQILINYEAFCFSQRISRSVFHHYECMHNCGMVKIYYKSFPRKMCPLGRKFYFRVGIDHEQNEEGASEYLVKFIIPSYILFCRHHQEVRILTADGKASKTVRHEELGFETVALLHQR